MKHELLLTAVRRDDEEGGLLRGGHGHGQGGRPCGRTAVPDDTAARQPHSIHASNWSTVLPSLKFWDAGLEGLSVLKFCDEGSGHLRCNTTMHDATTTTKPAHSSTTPRVAFCITGALRSFFAPIVHQSLLHNIIHAAGGQPRVFFEASAADAAVSDVGFVSVASRSAETVSRTASSSA